MTDIIKSIRDVIGTVLQYKEFEVRTGTQGLEGEKVTTRKPKLLKGRDYVVSYLHGKEKIAVAQIYASSARKDLTFIQWNVMQRSYKYVIEGRAKLEGLLKES